MNKIKAYGYYFTGTAGQLLERRDFSIENLSEDEVAVQVAGCGLCHTDISFMTGGVKTKHPLPLILGHEISGKVVASGPIFEKKLMGKNVIVPAVLPCGECELCRAGRDNICQKQKMPGNDFDGGFASHVVVPGRFLCELSDKLGNHKLSQLSVIADAVTTPYQSLMRAQVSPGDLALVIGTGGIGIYMVQHLKNTGAYVIAMDIDEKKLAIAKQQGADYGIHTANMAEKDIKGAIRQIVETNHLPKHKWKIFETSGSAGGQGLGFSLLTFASSLGIIGFTMEKLQIRLSNIMAFDADIFGNWGCRPYYYTDVVKQTLDGRINILDNIKEYPLDSINDVIAQALGHKLEKRAILTP